MILDSAQNVVTTSNDLQEASGVDSLLRCPKQKTQVGQVQHGQIIKGISHGENVVSGLLKNTHDLVFSSPWQEMATINKSTARDQEPGTLKFRCPKRCAELAASSVKAPETTSTR
jgi:hypothetical protein